MQDGHFYHKAAYYPHLRVIAGSIEAAILLSYIHEQCFLNGNDEFITTRTFLSRASKATGLKVAEINTAIGLLVKNKCVAQVKEWEGGSDKYSIDLTQLKVEEEVTAQPSKESESTVSHKQISEVINIIGKDILRLTPSGCKSLFMRKPLQKQVRERIETNGYDTVMKHLKMLADAMENKEKYVPTFAQPGDVVGKGWGRITMFAARRKNIGGNTSISSDYSSLDEFE